MWPFLEIVEIALRFRLEEIVEMTLLLRHEEIVEMTFLLRRYRLHSAPPKKKGPWLEQSRGLQRRVATPAWLRWSLTGVDGTGEMGLEREADEDVDEKEKLVLQEEDEKEEEEKEEEEEEGEEEEPHPSPSAPAIATCCVPDRPTFPSCPRPPWLAAISVCWGPGCSEKKTGPPLGQTPLSWTCA